MLGSENNWIVIVLGLGLIALIAWIVFRNGKLSGKLKVKDYVEAELNTERQPPAAPPGPTNANQAQAPPTSNATLSAKEIKDSKVVNADQGQGGHSTLTVDGGIVGSTVVNTTGPVNIGGILGTVGAGPGAPSTDSTPSIPADSTGLKQNVVNALVNLFDLGEIDGLCFDLGIDADEIKGDTKSEKARALVSYCTNRNKLGKLVALIKDKRHNTTL